MLKVEQKPYSLVGPGIKMMMNNEYNDDDDDMNNNATIKTIAGFFLKTKVEHNPNSLVIIDSSYPS